MAAPARPPPAGRRQSRKRRPTSTLDVQLPTAKKAAAVPPAPAAALALGGPAEGPESEDEGGEGEEGALEAMEGLGQARGGAAGPSAGGEGEGPGAAGEGAAAPAGAAGSWWRGTERLGEDPSDPLGWMPALLSEVRQASPETLLKACAILRTLDGKAGWFY